MSSVGNASISAVAVSIWFVGINADCGLAWEQFSQPLKNNALYKGWKIFLKYRRLLGSVTCRTLEYFLTGNDESQNLRES